MPIRRFLKFIDPLRLLIRFGVSAAALIVCWNTLWSGIQSLSFRYNFHYTESILATAIGDLKQNFWLYGPLDVYPHHLMPYTPLYAYAVHFLTGVTSVPILSVARCLTLASVFGVIALMTFAAFRAGRREWGLWLGALWISFPIIQGNRATVLPDCTALFFALSGVIVFLTAEDGKRKPVFCPASFCAGVLFFLSIWTKQNFAAAPISALLYGVMNRKWKQTLWVAAGLLIPLMVCSLIWQIQSGGHFLEHVLFSPSTIQRYSVRNLCKYWTDYYKEAWPFLMAAAAVEARAWRYKERVTVARIYAWLAMGMTAVLGKSGAGYNYFIEPTAAVCLYLALRGCGRQNPPAGESGKKEGLKRVVEIGCAVLLLLPLVWPLRGPMKPGFGLDPELKRQEADWEVLVPMIQKIPGDILSENPGLLIGFGRRVPYEPYEFAQLTYLGRFDERPMLKRLERGEFGLVILTVAYYQVIQSERFTQNFLDALRRYYRPLGVKYGYIFLVPKKPNPLHAASGRV